MTKFDYDLAVIGLGPAGMCAAGMGSVMGLKICAITSGRDPADKSSKAQPLFKGGVGGSCLSVGCIPSKGLLKRAHNAHIVKKELSAIAEGEDKPELTLESSAFTEETKAAARLLLSMRGTSFTEKLADDLFDVHVNKNGKALEGVTKNGTIIYDTLASFIDQHTLKLTPVSDEFYNENNPETITAKRIFVCTGLTPQIPQYDGIETIPEERLLTFENLWAIDPPQSLAIVGGSAIAVEMAESYAALGSKVTIIQRSEHLLHKISDEAGDLIEQVFEREYGIKTIHVHKPSFQGSDNSVSITFEDSSLNFEADYVLFATGLVPPKDTLGLDDLGIAKDKDGYIEVNKFSKTNIDNIYACGDICNRTQKLSHAAMYSSLVALLSCMAPRFIPMPSLESAVVPASIFTHPCVSHVGKMKHELERNNIKYDVIRVTYEGFGAATVQYEADGFVEVYVKPGVKGEVFGAVIVGEGSADMINYWALAITKKIGLMELCMTSISSFPAMSFLNRRISEVFVQKLFEENSKFGAICKRMW